MRSVGTCLLEIPVFRVCGTSHSLILYGLGPPSLLPTSFPSSSYITSLFICIVTHSLPSLSLSLSWLLKLKLSILHPQQSLCYTMKKTLMITNRGRRGSGSSVPVLTATSLLLRKNTLLSASSCWHKAVKEAQSTPTAPRLLHRRLPPVTVMSAASAIEHSPLTKL